jgi:hypothetical protein
MEGTYTWESISSKELSKSKNDKQNKKGNFKKRWVNTYFREFENKLKCLCLIFTCYFLS